MEKLLYIACGLWNDYGKQFHQYVEANNDSDKHMIIVLQFAKYNTQNRNFSKIISFYDLNV